MKRKLQIFVLSLAMLFVPGIGLLSAPAASAVDVFRACTTVSGASGTDVCNERSKAGNPITNAIKIATLIVSVAVGVASVIIIIISSFRMITSGGNPQQVASARSSLIYALVGLIIAALAGTIVGFVLTNV